MAATAAQRKAAERQRKKDEGYKLVWLSESDRIYLERFRAYQETGALHLHDLEQITKGQ